MPICFIMIQYDEDSLSNFFSPTSGLIMRDKRQSGEMRLEIIAYHRTKAGLSLAHCG